MLNCVKVVRDGYKNAVAEGFTKAKKETAKNFLKL